MEPEQIISHIIDLDDENMIMNPGEIIKDVPCNLFNRAIEVLSTINLEFAEINAPRELNIIIGHILFIFWRNNKKFTNKDVTKRVNELVIGHNLRKLEKNGLIRFSHIDEDGNGYYESTKKGKEYAKQNTRTG